VIEYNVLASHLDAAAEVLEVHFEEVLEVYDEQLLAMGSTLVAEEETHEQLRVQAHCVLREVTKRLGTVEAPSGIQQQWENQLPETLGASKARRDLQAREALEVGLALSNAALSVVVDNLPQSLTSGRGTATIASAIQTSVMEHVARGVVAYTDFLLEKIREAHVDERRRMSRELHDEVAHSIMVAFRNLELYELYRATAPSKAPPKLEVVKRTVQDALELTRNLSRKLRNFSVTEGLEMALSDLLCTSVSQGVQASISVEGDELLLTSQARDELFLILREGIRNAVTHSRASTIAIEVNINKNWARSTIEDNGRGFEPAKEAAHPSGAGLASIRERTSLLGGTLNLRSEPGKGTKIEVFLPLPRSRR
jgi:signal transduction histidine kinase